MAVNLRGTTRSGEPISYKDPRYASLEVRIESKLGLPSGSLSLIRTKGERSDADQVSEAGARSVYQIIPATRDAVLKKYGVDAWAGAEAAALAAGHVLKEGLDRNKGDMAAAVGEYHGGTDRRNWGTRTHAYQARIAGTVAAAGAPLSAGQGGGDPLGSQTTEAFLWGGNGLGADSFRRPLGPNMLPKLTAAEQDQQHVAAFGGMPATGAADTSQGGVQDIQSREAAEVADTQERASHGAWDRFSAGFQNNSLAAALVRQIDREHPEADPAFVRGYLADREKQESFAQDGAEVGWMREATSWADLDRIKGEIEEKRKRGAVQFSGGNTSGLLYGLAGGVADPAGWVAGLGVGKGLQLAGVSARAMYLSGRTGLAAGSVIAEGALGNLAVTAGLDQAGEHMTTTDYAAAAGFGGIIGAALMPIQLRGVRDETVRQLYQGIRENAAANTAALQTRAEANIGQTGEEAVNVEMRRLDALDKQDFVTRALADVPEQRKLFSRADAYGRSGELLTGDEAVRDAIVQRHG